MKTLPDHILLYHVTPDEAEEACFNRPHVRRARQGRLLVYGQTDTGALSPGSGKAHGTRSRSRHHGQGDDGQNGFTKSKGVDHG